jgi:heat shock protein HslJ
MRDARTFLVVGGVVALVALGALAATLAGGDDTANGSVPVESLDQLTGSWLAVNDASAPAVVIGTVRLEFSADGRVTAQTGCNGVRGQVSVQDSTLVAGPLMSTRMACEPALMEQERWVTEMLSSHPRLELSGPYLALHWGEGEQWWLGLEREPAGTSGTFPAS